MKLIDEIAALLPSRTSRWIMIVTPFATAFIFTYSPKLFTLFPQVQEGNKFLIQLLLTETTALCGLLLLVTSLIYYNHKLPNIEPLLKKAEERMKRIGTQEYKLNTNLTDKLDYQIMFNILKIKGLNQRATPNVIAKEIGSTPEIVLAHLNEMHEKLLTTFPTKESPPSLDTDFFLSEKAYMHIDIKKSNKEYLEDIKKSNEAMPDRESSQFDDIY